MLDPAGCMQTDKCVIQPSDQFMATVPFGPGPVAAATVGRGWCTLTSSAVHAGTWLSSSLPPALCNRYSG